MPALTDVPVDGKWRIEPFDGGTLMRRRRYCLIRYVHQGAEVQRQIACETPDKPFLFPSLGAAERFMPELERREKRMEKVHNGGAETPPPDLEVARRVGSEQLKRARDQFEQASVALREAGKALAEAAGEIERRLEAARQALERQRDE